MPPLLPKTVAAQNTAVQHVQQNVQQNTQPKKNYWDELIERARNQALVNKKTMSDLVSDWMANHQPQQETTTTPVYTQPEIPEPEETQAEQPQTEQPRPMVQPVAEPEEPTVEEVVEPETTEQPTQTAGVMPYGDTRQRQNETQNTPVPETPEETFDEWTNYLEQQEQAEDEAEEGRQTITPQRAEESGYVAPVTNNPGILDTIIGLGAQPASAESTLSYIGRPGTYNEGTGRTTYDNPVDALLYGDQGANTVPINIESYPQLRATGFTNPYDFSQFQADAEARGIQIPENVPNYWSNDINSVIEQNNNPQPTGRINPSLSEFDAQMEQNARIEQSPYYDEAVAMYQESGLSQAEAEARARELISESGDMYTSETEDEPNGFLADATAQAANAIVNDVVYEGAERRQLDEMTNQLYQAMGGTTNPDDIQGNRERLERARALAEQIQADDLIDTERPEITGQQVNDWATQTMTDALYPLQNLVEYPFSSNDNEADNAYNTAEEKAMDAVESGDVELGSKEYYDLIDQYVAEENSQTLESRLADIMESGNDYGYEQALANGLVEGTPEFDQFIAERAENASAKNDRSQGIFDFVNQGYTPAQAAYLYDHMDENGEISQEVYDAVNANPYIGETRPDQDYVWEAPAIVDGKNNDSLDAILRKEQGFWIDPATYGFTEGTDAYEVTMQGNAERALSLFDQGANGSFEGVTIPDSVKDYLATSKAGALGMLDQRYIDEETGEIKDSSNPRNVEYINATEEDYQKAIEDFIEANPQLAEMIGEGIITVDDIMRHFFKGLKVSGANGTSGGYGGGYGYGYGRYYGGYGGGGWGGYGGWGGSSYTPNVQAKNQEEQRINNIMKNWSF